MVRRYEVVFDEEFAKELRGIARAGRRDVVRRVGRLLDRLEDDPYSPRSGADVRPLHGEREPTFRARVGDYRVVYTVDERGKRVYVTSIFHRGEGYV